MKYLGCLIAAAVASGCSSSDAPSPGFSSPGPGPSLRVDAGAINDAGAQRDALPSEERPRDYSIPQPERLYVICPSEVIDFDLTTMRPSDEMLVSLRDAWDQETQASVLPTWMMRLGALDRGPVDMAMGTVQVDASRYAFVGSPFGTADIAVPIDKNQLSIIKVDARPSEFALSFGADPDARRSLFVSSVRVDTRLDATCTSISGTVELIIPLREANKTLGGQPLNELFESTVDTNGDGTHDGWRLVLTGTAPALEGLR